MDRNIKILIADDSPFMRKMLKEILEVGGFKNIIEAGDGNEALEKHESENPDLVLLDIIMPKLDGIEILKKIGEGTKTLIISAVGKEDIIEEAKELGANGYIVKPFDEKRVMGEIEKVLSK